MAARHAQTAGWSARFAEAAPSAVLGAVLIALIGLLAWMAISLVDLNARVTALESRVEKGFAQTDARLARLETSVIDIYKLLAERLPPPEKNRPQR